MKFLSKTADPLNDFAANQGSPFFLRSLWSSLSVKSRPTEKPEIKLCASSWVFADPFLPIRTTTSSSCSIVFFYGTSILLVRLIVEFDF